MKLLAGSFVVLGSILLAAVPALAQPPPPPPVPMEDPAGTPTGGYPADLPGRPLLLPASQAEIDVNFRIPTDDVIDFFDLVLLGVQARYNLGTVEPFVGVDLAIYKPDGVDVLAAINAGSRFAIGPGAAKAAFFFFSPGTDDGYQELELDGSYEYKHHINPQFAVVAEGGLAYNSGTFTGITPDDLVISVFSLFARGAGQIKITPELSGEAGILLSLPLATSTNDDTIEAENPDPLFGFHGMGLYNVGKFDVYGRLDVRDRDGSTTIVTVGVLARPMM
jgi:hypothetical protein